MSSRAVRLLGVSGSLRRVSTHTMLLHAAAAAAPKGVGLRLFDGLGHLPIFNPDLEDEPLPPAVLHWRGEVRESDGLIVACPEYAHGIPGGLKNALDWLISGSEAPGKPVALFHATARSTHGRETLIEVLRTMAMDVRPELSITVPMIGLPLETCADVLSRAPNQTLLRTTLTAFADHLSLRAGGARH